MVVITTLIISLTLIITSMALDLRTINALARHFDMIQPWLACHGNFRANGRLLRTGISGRPIGIVSNISSFLLDDYDKGKSSQSAIVCLDDYFTLKNDQLLTGNFDGKAIGTTWILVTKNESFGLEICKRSVIQFNQRIYVFNEESGALSETYLIGNRSFTNALGQLETNTKINMTKKSFLQRRSNLQGLTLKAMIERQPPFMMYPARLREGADSEWTVNPSGDQVKDITHEQRHFYGLFLNSLRILEREMNFKTIFNIRRDQGWGHIVNGSWTGMIRTLQLGEADFIAASLTLHPMRFTVIDYLHPIGTETPSMIITADGIAIFSWLTYFKPFQATVWYFLLSNTVVLTIFIWLLRSYNLNDQNSCSNLIFTLANDFWSICMTYFGGPGIKIQGKSLRALSVLLLIVFLAHTVVFMSYKSSLTAELAVVRERLPFSSLEDLFESEFRLITVKGQRHSFNLFGNAHEQSNLNKLYTKYIEPYLADYEFDTIDDALHEISTTPQRTYLVNYEALHDFPQYRCNVQAAWKSRYPRFLSFGFPKHSVYKEFFDFNLLRQIETGVQDILVYRRMKDKKEICGKVNRREPEDVTIGPKKLIALFAWMGGAFVVSVVIMCLEKLSALKQNVADTHDIMHDKYLENKLQNDLLLLRFGSFMVDWDERQSQNFLAEIKNYSQCRIKQLTCNQNWE